MTASATQRAPLGIRSLRRIVWGIGALALIAGGSAQAQTVPARDSSVHRLAVDGNRLHVSRRTYRLVLTDTAVRSLGEVESQAAVSQYGNTPAWVLTRSGAQGVNAVSESLFVSRAALRPLHWSAVQGRARLAAEFVGDSIFGVMTSPLGRQNILLHNRGDLLVNVDAVDALLEAIPLGLGWSDSATVLVVDPGGSITVPATISVVGEERMVLLSGDFDCWVVELETERGVERLWVNKRDQMVVRSEQPLPQLGGAILDRVLLKTEPPTQP